MFASTQVSITMVFLSVVLWSKNNDAWKKKLVLLVIQSHKCFSLRQPSYITRQQKCIMYICCLPHRILFKSALKIQDLVKVYFYCFLKDTLSLSCQCMVVKNVTTSTVDTMALMCAKLPAVLPTIAFVLTVQILTE